MQGNYTEIVGAARPRSRSEGAIRATLTGTYSASSLLRAKHAAFPSTSLDLCSTASGVEPLVFVRGNMNTEAYCIILDNEILPTLRRIFGMDPCYFQDDNARCHVARATMQWYADNNVGRLDWPAQSADLNPIEHLWDELDRRARARPARPKSIAQLMEWLQEEWRRIPVDVLQTLVESMPDRAAAVIAARDVDARCLCVVRCWERSVLGSLARVCEVVIFWLASRGERSAIDALIRRILAVLATDTARLPPRRTGFNPRPVHSGLLQVGIVADDATGRRDFSRRSPVSPHTPHQSGAAPSSPHFTLIGSQDIAVKSRPNIFTHSLTLPSTGYSLSVSWFKLDVLNTTQIRHTCGKCNHRTSLLLQSNWNVPIWFVLPEAHSRRRLTTAGHTHLHVFLVRFPNDKRSHSQCYLFNISGPVYRPVEGVSATVFRKVLLQSRSGPDSMFEGVIKQAVQLRPDHFVAVYYPTKTSVQPERDGTQQLPETLAYKESSIRQRESVNTLSQLTVSTTPDTHSKAPYSNQEEEEAIPLIIQRSASVLDDVIRAVLPVPQPQPAPWSRLTHVFVQVLRKASLSHANLRHKAYEGPNCPWGEGGERKGNPPPNVNKIGRKMRFRGRMQPKKRGMGNCPCPPPQRRACRPYWLHHKEAQKGGRLQTRSAFDKDGQLGDSLLCPAARVQKPSKGSTGEGGRGEFVKHARELDPLTIHPPSPSTYHSTLHSHHCPIPQTRHLLIDIKPTWIDRSICSLNCGRLVGAPPHPTNSCNTSSDYSLKFRLPFLNFNRTPPPHATSNSVSYIYALVRQPPPHHYICFIAILSAPNIPLTIARYGSDHTIGLYQRSIPVKKPDQPMNLNSHPNRPTILAKDCPHPRLPAGPKTDSTQQPMMSLKDLNALDNHRSADAGVYQLGSPSATASLISSTIVQVVYTTVIYLIFTLRTSCGVAEINLVAALALSYLPGKDAATPSVKIRGRSVRAVSPLASHQDEPGSIPGRVTGFSHVRIVRDDAVGRRAFPRPFIPAPLHTRLNHPHRLSRPRC
ncbi:hypothetical protein PR048_023893 [Dryococelus australis]|uniref:Transposase n=1 Tax=Dryococelus australis TaxID=614101 RepID=A0ABQ9GVC6_9NEOP|nr:hypothetical protein PR048_023893 [Dryococelus australis]